MSEESAPSLEPWFPPWAQHLAETHASGQTQTFILHGNVDDLVRVETKDGVRYAMLPEFLASQVFGQWDAVLAYDQVNGPRPLASTQARLDKMNRHIERFIGPVEELRKTRQPAQVFPVLNRYLDLVLLREGERPSVALILDYAHFLAPSTDVSHTSRELASALTTLLNWSKSPHLKKIPLAFCLISERLSDLHASLVQNAHTLKVELPHPERAARLQFILWSAAGRDFAGLCEVSAEQLADLTAGLTLVHLQGLMHRAIRAGKRITLADLKIYKKRMIEGQCQGLVEFIEPPHTLDMVVGHEAGKARLNSDAELIRRGRQDSVPMGYLFCGPVGTGKTFLAECYAGSVGVPCLKLLNFRSKYVGETEGNLEKILKVLRVMGPVVVIIDEADAMLGDRAAGGDSGTSSRVFGQFASQMGNTLYRGKIIWFLLTCRPDLLPIDIKRQGRCEVHIPLFYPSTQAEYADMLRVLGKKNHIDVSADEVPEVPKEQKLSGADVEGVLTRAKRLALLEGGQDVTRAHLQAALDEFMPSTEGDEKTLQIMAAILECTDKSFLPADMRQELSSPQGRMAVLRRYRELKLALGEGA
ncbi:MAG TPA: AAA family ATPase [Myxococcota bacterium]|nr:AAA family ATPase [Myxococcota bacterium]HRY95289.1 AAA family ATPase [Myxococcota bacterium]HSA20887.1 AAA family ATPase [Myxococcota bacterium]